MADAHFAVKCRQRAGTCGAGVAMHQNDVGLHLGQHLVHARHGPCKQAVERLVGLHHGEIEIGADLEQRHHLIKHLPMLSGHADQ
ncbi:hypothetical protein SDC9_140157 [bioreactor metagenome]|uniref:Uncharacterized protein n=1 Tax=bioreactor metagenome TaxID=1076179 RepID=A0A645DUL0_9ZZZZ